MMQVLMRLGTNQNDTPLGSEFLKQRVASCFWCNWSDKEKGSELWQACCPQEELEVEASVDCADDADDRPGQMSDICGSFI